MQVNFRIFRFDPLVDPASRFEEHSIEAAPTDRILDCLNRIRWERDPTLAYRMSCAHGVCGSDGMRIDGRCSLACQRLVRDYEDVETILVEPLPGFPVVRDLVVDLSGFLARYREVRPWLQPATDPPSAGERLQSIEERAAFDEAIRCIFCGCCTAACPEAGSHEEFVGPAALVKVFRFVVDSRDGAADVRLAAAEGPRQTGGCRMHGRCTEVCPKDIDVRRLIGRTKRRIRERTD